MPPARAGGIAHFVYVPPSYFRLPDGPIRFMALLSALIVAACLSLLFDGHNRKDRYRLYTHEQAHKTTRPQARLSELEACQLGPCPPGAS